jgi:hypothetical protein
VSLELIDLGKLKVDEVTDAWLRYKSRISGQPIALVVREELHSLAVRDVHAATLLLSLTPVTNPKRDLGGRVGQPDLYDK